MFCSSCGNKLEEAVKFCSHCGAGVNTTEATQSSQSESVALPEGWEATLKKVGESFGDAPWVYKYLENQTQWEGESQAPAALEQPMLSCFSGRFLPSAMRQGLIIFTPTYITIVAKKIVMYSQLDLVVPKDKIARIDVKLIEVPNGAGPQFAPLKFWHVAIITERAIKGINTMSKNAYKLGRAVLPLTYPYFTTGELDFYLPAGATDFEREKFEGVLKENLAKVAHYYPVTINRNPLKA
jgi:hypothetical protein